MPMALLPPPTQATTASGSRPAWREHLAAGLEADHRLELADHERVRMRTEGRAEQVVGVGDVGHPVAHRLVDGVLQRAGAAVDASHARAEPLHARDVRRLARHVLGAHVDLARAGRAARTPWPSATPCWPAPVSAITRDFPIRCASSAWPIALLILCAPVWVRSSRLRKTRAPPTRAREPRRLGQRRRTTDVVREQPRRARRRTRGRLARRGRRARAPRPARPASPARSGRRTAPK